MIHTCSFKSKVIHIVFILICIENLLTQNVRKQVVFKCRKRKELQVLIKPSRVINVGCNCVVNCLSKHHRQISRENSCFKSDKKGEE